MLVYAELSKIIFYHNFFYYHYLKVILQYNVSTIGKI